MKNKKRNLVAGALVTGAIITGSAFNINVANALSFKTLGNGAEVRSNLSQNQSKPILAYDQSCGEKADTTKTNQKVIEAKCGEGKCGDKKSEKKTDKTAEQKSDKAKADTPKDSKTKDAKCGEGKCGN